MAVAFVSVGTGSGVTGTSDTDIAPSIPSGSNGDLLVAVCVRGGSASGWAQLSNGSFYCLYRIADGTEGSSVTIDVGATFRFSAGVVLRFSGAATDGISLGTATETAAWSTTVNLPTVTALAGGAIVWMGVRGATTDSRNTSSCSRAGATERYDAQIDSNSWPLWVWTEHDTSAGSVSGATLTLSSAVNTKWGNALVIPAAASASVVGPLLQGKLTGGGILVGGRLVR
jgi:hypothetical protein